MPKVSKKQPAIEWRRKRIAIKLLSGVVETVEAMVSGNLAVHGPLRDDDQSLTVITHAPSNMAAIRFKDPADAIAAAEWMLANCAEALAQKTASTVKIAMSEKVIAWAIKCNKSKKLEAFPE